MDTRRSYEKTAEAYADGVRGLYAPATARATDRGGAALVAAQDLASKAEELAPISSDLTQAALIRLASDDPQVRARASTDLLAKALADLEVSQLLYDEAVKEERREVPPGARALAGHADRGGGTRAVYGYLDTLTHKKGAVGFAALTDRAPSPTSIPDAQTELRDGVEAVLTFIPKAAAKTGQKALNGLVGLGLKNLAQAAGVVGMDVARFLGLGDRVSRLYQLFQSYVAKAYEAVLALIGNKLAKTMADKVIAWFADVRKGKEFGKLLEQLYQTKATGRSVAKTIKASKADLAAYTAAITDVSNLRERVESNIGLADKFVTGLGYLAWIPLAAMPQAQLLLAAGYVALGIYVILAGGDAVDAPALEQFNYTPGVIEILKARQI